MFGKCFFHVLRIFRDTLTHIIFRILIVYHPFSNNAICFCNKFVTFPVTFSVTSLYILFRICNTFCRYSYIDVRFPKKLQYFQNFFKFILHVQSAPTRFLRANRNAPATIGHRGRNCSSVDVYCVYLDTKYMP